MFDDESLKILTKQELWKNLKQNKKLIKKKDFFFIYFLMILK
jgi:hypothetical protein